MDIDGCFYTIPAIVGYRRPQLDDTSVGRYFDEALLCDFLRNDPRIVRLEIACYDFRDDDRRELGLAIGNSTNLRELIIGGDWQNFSLEEYCFSWIAQNRSIEIFNSSNFCFTEEEFALLAPFFEHNRNLRCIELEYGNASVCIPTLISALSHLDMNRLARIDLGGSNIGDRNAADLVNTLHEMSGLQNLLDLWLRENMIGRDGCLALRSLLKNPKCGIISLDLSINLVDDECIGILVGGFVVCDTLKSLSIGAQRLLTTTGWNTFSTFVSSSKCLLENIVLYQTCCVNESATTLGNSLAMNATLTCLDISFNDFIPPFACCRGLLNSLAPTSAILELILEGWKVNDDGALLLFSTLANNATVKKLKIRSGNITPAGWVACFRRLIDSRSVLTDMDFEDNIIDDEGVSALVDLVARHMDTVSSLNLFQNPAISFPRMFSIIRQCLGSQLFL